MPSRSQHDNPKSKLSVPLVAFISVGVIAALIIGYFLFGAGDGLTTTPSGLKYKDETVGTGASPEAGKSIKVHYTGWLENGTKFDSSVDRGQPFTFQIGRGQVIKGWDEGVMSMKVGGKRRLVIPPDLGYGARGQGTIPPNSTLIFDVELIDVN
ncbi:MAG: FKBP-type peptidyl-prolyl cis-trans isomerase [Acidobacteria bacterium]|nr:FKBP-type peptidyl-prolyl cis-trans isomerase [Acidobacteriota bacterium]MCW5967188.1 FKBP-type peptidyl-prolyl cis-trans isomerase [Blastocatellales bacterium]